MTDNKKMKINNKFVIVAIIVLVAIVAVCVAIYAGQNKDDDKSGYTLTVMEDSKETASFTLQDIREMKTFTADVDLSSGSKADVKGKFKGVLLKDVLNSADKGLLKKYDKFITVAGDGYSSALSKKEVMQDKNVMVAYSCDGEDLVSFENGGTGPMRIIMTKDTYGTRSIQYLVKVICK